ncbi:MAG: tetratricopeptide repeat protein [Bacteroidetes bacterium]|nr:tetratricopeptide repeat protein [Bacteroidota bacterium]
MKYFLFIAIIILSFSTATAQNKVSEIQTKSSLAIRYYNAKDYEKAIPLLKDVYKISKNGTYFKYYLNCLVQLNRYTEAELTIQKEVKKQGTPKPEFYIHWGYVLKAQERIAEAEEKYQEAINKIQANKGSFLITASNFLSWGEYEYAKQTYLKGREVLAPEQFNYELARAYLYLRDYENMMEEYLNLLRQSEKQLSRVQSSLSSAMRLDIDDGLRNKFREQVLKRIQAEPQIIGYNRLLIWFFLQENKFASALRQSVALDRRTSLEAAQIVQLGNMALKNKKYVDAKNAFDYLMKKGVENPFYGQAFALNIHASYLQFISEFPDDKSKGEIIAVEFKKGLEFLGIAPATLILIQENAHLLAFYLDETEAAISLLKTGLKIPQLKPEQLGQLKTEMADIYVFANDPWEATLIYSQVIDANKKNSLGDEVKLKKAKLGYYLGNFSWAKAQLDVLKASTSKLTANDAMELSLLIGNNLNLDTTAIPLTMFAKADLRFFQNNNEEAMVILDGLTELYPYHTLVDDILFRKAKIEIGRQNHTKAAEYLEQIVSDFSYDLLADDALFMVAELYNYNLDEKEKAKGLYKDMLTQHPGSVFIDESREKYRELREIYPDKESDIDKEIPFMKAIENNEIN